MTPGVLLFASYLLGSIPSSYLAGRLTRGIDLREHGSGNLGATNTFRVLGAAIAAPVMIVDILKGWFPVAFFPLWDGSPQWTWALVYGASAIFGHVFSVFTRFQGGKGVATAAGVFLALAPLAVGIALAVWLTALLIWRMVSLASILAAVTLMIVLLVADPRPSVLGLGIAVATFVVYAHRSNISRILRGEEYRFGRRAPEPEPLTEEPPQ